MFIYLIVNRKTGKYYVGQHKGDNLRKYLQQKFHHAQNGISGHSRLFNSMRKHPTLSAWSIHALRSDIMDRAELDQTEKDFIAFLRSQDPEFGYNICRGGEGFTGPHSPDFGVNQSRVMKEVWKRPDFKEKMARRKGRLGQKASEETRYRLRISHTGICPTPEALLKRERTKRLRGVKPPMLGKSHTEKTREKMRKAQSLRWLEYKRTHKPSQPKRKYTVSEVALQSMRRNVAIARASLESRRTPNG